MRDFFKLKDDAAIQPNKTLTIRRSDQCSNPMLAIRALLTFIIVTLFGILTACAPIQSPTENQYKIIAFSAKKVAPTLSSQSILISQPDAMTGYQTEQMLYVNKPYQLSSFAHNSWIGPPATMLTPLIVQSLQHSHYFDAVAAGPNADKTDYRLDTQLIALHQNFLTKPSTLELSVQVVLTRVNENRVIASRTFVECVPCLSDTPYGGVLATNKATQAFTAQLTDYVIAKIKHDGLGRDITRPTAANKA